MSLINFIDRFPDEESSKGHLRIFVINKELCAENADIQNIIGFRIKISMNVNVVMQDRL